MQKYDVRPLFLARLKTEGQELCRSNSGTQSVVVLHLALSYLLIKCYSETCVEREVAHAVRQRVPARRAPPGKRAQGRRRP